MKPFYISSTGKGLSATVAGFSVAGAVEAIVLALNFFGYSIDHSLLLEFVTDGVQAVGITVSLFGLLRKSYYLAIRIVESIKEY